MLLPFHLFIRHIRTTRFSDSFASTQNVKLINKSTITHTTNNVNPSLFGHSTSVRIMVSCCKPFITSVCAFYRVTNLYYSATLVRVCLASYGKPFIILALYVCVYV